MKKVDYDRIVMATPTCMPRFRLKKAEDWQKRQHGIQDGDEYLYHPNGVMIPLSDKGPGLGTHASKFEFIDYVLVVGGGLSRYIIVKEGVDIG